MREIDPVPCWTPECARRLSRGTIVEGEAFANWQVPFDRNGLVSTWQLKWCDARVKNGGTPVIDSGKATVDRRIKLNRINYFLAVAAEGGCNIGEASALPLPA